MNSLFKYEFMKIAKKRMNLVVVLVSLSLTLLLFILPVKSYISLERDGHQVTGIAAIQLEKEYARELAGMLTEERVAKDIASYQALFSKSENVVKDGSQLKLKEDMFTRYVLPYYSYYKMIDDAFLEPQVTDNGLTVLRDLKSEEAGEFYKAREDKVTSYLNMDFSDWTYSTQEKAFWNAKNSQVDAPYVYGYHAGWKSLFQCFELLIVSIIAICICVAPVFAGEYQTGADSVILSTRYGKSMLIKAKIAAAFLYGLLIFSIHLGLAAGIQLVAFGMDGWDLPLQILNVTIPYSFTMLEAALIWTGILYSVLFGMISVTLLLSAKMKTAFVVLVIDVLIVLLPVFLGLSGSNGVLNHMLMLLPYMAVQPVFPAEYSSYFSYPLPGLTISVITMRVGLYVMVTIICLPFIGRAFKRHQVQ
ncbi:MULTISPECIES: ABC transporter permease [unclassified Paenibacillus]|uniref:ABC transporter permease n=2 Tax=Paenibacillus TaxID=44249 RepID=UPI0003E2313B|nr:MULTISPECIES: ABC transporter permease [unclassified Paenibacillus]ETT32265.1 putative transmembrane protein [Paenibacillus sp. FSL R7-269]OMF88518.1 ABC transporter permease [Paenibacillus sp. FSL R7-0337]